MHILIIPSWYMARGKPGDGTFFFDQATALSKKIDKVGIVYVYGNGIRGKIQQRNLKYGFISELEQDHFVNRVYELPSIPKTRSLTKAIIYNFWKKRVSEYIKEHGRPDLVHLHSYKAGEIALWIKETYGIDYVLTEHQSSFTSKSLPEKEMKKARNIFQNSRKNIAVSRELQVLLNNEYDLDFVYIPNMVDTEFFSFRNNEKNNETFSFLNVGKLIKRKGQLNLIMAFKKVHDKYKDTRLTIAGSGDQYKVLKKEIKNRQLEDSVELFGYATKDDVKKLLKKTDCFMLSSFAETFGVVIIEAMSSGIPVVATRCSGPETIIIDDSYGFLCEKDISDMADKMIACYEKEYDFYKIRKYAEENYSFNVVSDKIINLYKNVLNMRSKAERG